MPERLALVHVGNVHLDDRPVEGVQRVEDGDRRVGEGGGIDDDAGRALAGGMNEVDDLVFAIALWNSIAEPECSWPTRRQSASTSASVSRP